MEEHGFEWDDAKAERNYRKHGVDFPDATEVFDDPLRLEWRDVREDYGEERFCTVGEIKRRVLFVAYTMRAEKIRIIMARRASRKEKGDYYGNRQI